MKQEVVLDECFETEPDLLLFLDRASRKTCISSKLREDRNELDEEQDQLIDNDIDDEEEEEEDPINPEIDISRRPGSICDILKEVLEVNFENSKSAEQLCYCVWTLSVNAANRNRFIINGIASSVVKACAMSLDEIEKKDYLMGGLYR